MASDNQHFCLRWNNHQSTLISVFDTLLESGTLVDCTLAAEGQYMKAHKVVLCACSPYLEVLLSQHYEKHPIVILKDIKFQELKSMMDYMYRGEVNISQDQLSTFLKAAESLQIKGLTDGGGNEDGAASNAPSKAPIAAPVRKPVSVHQPTSRSSAGPQGLTIERRPDSPHMSSRADSASPTPKRRRRNQRRPSTSDDPDSHVDTSNSCDVPPLQSGALSGVGVPNIPATITKGGAPLDDGDHETENSGINNHDASAADGVAGPKIEPTGGDLIEPKTEYMDDMNNEDSIEDLTLDDDDDMDNSVDMSRAGPSHDNSNQSYGQWPMTGNQGDEVFMAAQDAVGAHRDTQAELIDYQKRLILTEYYKFTGFHTKEWFSQEPEDVPGLFPHHLDPGAITIRTTTSSSGSGVKKIRNSSNRSPDEARWVCPTCGKRYKYSRGLAMHRRLECGKEPMFHCPFCPQKCHQKGNMVIHIKKKHPTQYEEQSQAVVQAHVNAQHAQSD